MHFVLILYFAVGGQLTSTNAWTFTDSAKCKAAGDAYIASDPKAHGYECVAIPK